MPFIEKPGDDEDTHDANREAYSHGDRFHLVFDLGKRHDQQHKNCEGRAPRGMLGRYCGIPIRIRPGNRDAPAILAIAGKVRFMAKGWSLEEELCQLARAPDLAVAFAKLGFAVDGQKLPRIRTVMDWHRSGAETYSYIFAILPSSNIERRYRLKACVSFGSNTTVEGILQLWILRRSVLAAEGVTVPKLIASGSGVILEEEIPLHVSKALQSVSSETVLAQLLNIAAAIARLRFLPVDGLADVRSRGNDAVYVDFGSDLGAPNRVSSSPDIIFRQLIEQIERWRYTLTTAHVDALLESYLARVSLSV
jgi:hypothetical protein